MTQNCHVVPFAVGNSNYFSHCLQLKVVKFQTGWPNKLHAQLFKFGGVLIRIVKLIELRDIEHISLEFFWKSINCVCVLCTYRSGLETKQTSCISEKT